MNDTSHYHTWTTADEMEYLDGISTHGNFRPEQRLELLQGYQEAMKYRPKSEKYLDFGRLRERVQELINVA